MLYNYSQYEPLKSVVLSKEYDLRDILYRIDAMYNEAKLTNAEKAELQQLARENADPANSYEPETEQLKERVGTLESQMLTAMAEIEALKNGSTEGPVEPEVPMDEYPEYVQPTGAHNAYHVDDKITWKGKKYTCLFEGCNWNPDEYPQGWQLVEETA